jgi:hypothetical protein
MNFIRNLFKQTESLSVIANIAEDPRFQIVKHDSFATKYSMENPPVFVTTLREKHVTKRLEKVDQSAIQLIALPIASITKTKEVEDVTEIIKYRVVQTPQMVAQQKEIGGILRGKDIVYSDRLYATLSEKEPIELKVSPYIIEMSSKILLAWRLNKL